MEHDTEEAVEMMHRAWDKIIMALLVPAAFVPGILARIMPPGYRPSNLLTILYLAALAVVALIIVFRKWLEEEKTDRVCPLCHGSGFERCFAKIEIQHGRNAHHHPSWITVEKHLGYFLCPNCNEPDAITVLSEIEKIKRIKELLDK